MTVSKFLDPKNDVAFKKIFGTEKNKDILIHFLNDMIAFKERAPITDVSFLKTTLDPETMAQKTSIVDILCKDTEGNVYIVEMQVAREKGFEKRAQYYASKAYCSQVNNGGKYHDLKEVIFLAISDFVMFPNKKSYKSDHVILDKKSREHDLKDFSFTFLELPKFNKKIGSLKTMVDKWAYFFKHAPDLKNEDLQRVIDDDEILERAYDELDRFSWSDQELLGYDQAEKYEGCYQASMAQKFDEGVDKGRKEGRKEGEKIAMKKMATRLLKEGVSMANIRKLTGLTMAEIKSIKKS